ncbi:unnamed protein product [Diatraea saccharalis]|uniref:Uncharacterized protein n=1 Tax=Diatraea saccharalis TaxID=40085 RepID=A0A9N9WE45_9NEOP|nr:unnamed protein product [Diatraea saccharalis]
MGMTWKITMPLLSTLAALVIIVHSAEEDAERDYRYELRPKALDMRPSDYGQTWRMAEPLIQQSINVDTWNDDTQEASLVRRRPGRKRKRRPPADSADDEAPRNKYIIKVDEKIPIRQNYEPLPEDDAEMPRRRRKRIRPNRWRDEPVNEDAPIRRRLQKRKRPSLDNWPILSEFGEFGRDTKEDREIEDGRNTKDDGDIDNDRYTEVAQDDDEKYTKDTSDLNHKRVDADDEYIDKEIKLHMPRPKSKFSLTGKVEDESQFMLKEDKFLSEFSMEIMNPTDKNEKKSQEFINLQNKINEKSPTIPSNMDIAQDQNPINPQTLKNILKRSNGTSLSEILQRHNLTLADLLSGKENAISVLRSEELIETHKNVSMSGESVENKLFQPKTDSKVALRKNIKQTNGNTEKQYDREFNESNNRKSDRILSKEEYLLSEKEKINAREEKKIIKNLGNSNNMNNTLTISEVKNIQNLSINTNSTPAILAKRRFSGGIRRKLRMRPMLSNYKSQLNRDLIALSARRYSHHNRRNTTKAKEWKDMLPLMPNLNITDEVNVDDENTPAPKSDTEETTTTLLDTESLTTSTITDIVDMDNDAYDPPITTTEEAETTTIVLEILESEMPASITERPIITPIVRTVSGPGMRRQSYNNRLKKKRLKHKTATTEPPPNDVKNFLNIGDYVSSSEFIPRTQLPKFTSTIDIKEAVTELEDFMTTETMSPINNEIKTKKPYLHALTSKATTVTDYPTIITTEETAKIEIEEILSDTTTSDKLSKILKERNMTLNELLEHRERGSSHVHLADIFHNASREPNPPEPFLTKSLLEPISKETYPLRALLDANSHDTTTKSSTNDLISLVNHVTIPVTMAFGNNVNENAENMGIMSLFNNFTKDADITERTTLQKDSEGTLYKSTIINVNATDDDSETRGSRMISDDQDMVSWNEIFAMVRKHNRSTDLDKSNKERHLSTTHNNVTFGTDADGDGLIVHEDLQHASEIESNAVSGSLEKVEFDSYESGEILHDHSRIPNNLPSSAKSVTVATASLVGLAMILFLLTYTVLKWKQQKSRQRKNNFHNERIPSPVFENRKIKKNCSSRSISPMLPTSNIYTMSTLETQNGKESPEYMWDTLRKPFQ